MYLRVQAISCHPLFLWRYVHGKYDNRCYKSGGVNSRFHFHRLPPIYISRNALQAEALRKKTPEAIGAFLLQINSNPFQLNSLRIKPREDVRLGYSQSFGVHLQNVSQSPMG
jgi:hypothetical protein